MSASVAANDIWKLGWTTASGTSSMTASAATAMVRMVSVARSIMTPTKTTAIMMKERCVFPLYSHAADLYSVSLRDLGVTLSSSGDYVRIMCAGREATPVIRH